MRLSTFIAKRLAYAGVQVAAITSLVFFLIRLLPGDPSFFLAGPSPTEARLAAIRRSLRLDESLGSQFVAYVSNLWSGDWGRSIITSNNVLDDVLTRFPATFELITAAVLLAVLVMLPWSAWSAANPNRTIAKIGDSYGRLAGSLPDFWIALVLLLVFFSWLDLAPPPVGRLGLATSPPETVTRLYVIDSLITGQFATLGTALAHLILPAISLIAVVGGVFYRQTRTAMGRELNRTRVLYARASGLPERTVWKRAMRNALPPAVAAIGNTYGYLIGGAVLVESVFSWGGIGQYAVQAVQSSDYFAISGIVLATSIFTLLVWLTVDLVNGALDPRTR